MMLLKAVFTDLLRLLRSEPKERDSVVVLGWRPSPSARRHCDPATTAGAAVVVVVAAAAAAAAASYLFSAAHLAYWQRRLWWRCWECYIC